MSNYVENKKKIEAIRDRYGDYVFRGGISHLMDVGIRHLTKENVEETCKEIMQSDDTRQFMSNEFKCELIKAAYELAQISHIDLLVYIQREVEYDVFDGSMGYKRTTKLLRYCMAEIEQNYDCNKEEVLDTFENIGFDDNEIEALGYGYLINEEEND